MHEINGLSRVGSSEHWRHVNMQRFSSKTSADYHRRKKEQFFFTACLIFMRHYFGLYASIIYIQHSFPNLKTFIRFISFFKIGIGVDIFLISSVLLDSLYIHCSRMLFIIDYQKYRLSWSCNAVPCWFGICLACTADLDKDTAVKFFFTSINILNTMYSMTSVLCIYSYIHVATLFMER
jgi:hypothetical protein